MANDTKREREAPPADHVEETIRDSIFFAKLERDTLEAWTWAAVGLFACAVVVFGIAYAGLGHTSAYAYGVGIPLLGLFAAPIVIWGLARSMTKHPVFRPSRVLGFMLLTVTAAASGEPFTAAPVSTSDYTSERTFRLPFDGTWTTIHGGDDLDSNGMAKAFGYRFGYSFTVTKDGALHTGDGSALEDYHCFGEPVLAPTTGEVIQVVSDAPDMPIGEADHTKPAGNHVFMKVADGESLMLAFMKEASVTAEVGDVVEAGQVLGACGNSGQAGMPNLRVHMQDTDEVITEGLPLPFSDYEIVTEGTPQPVALGTPTGSGSIDDLTDAQRVRPRAK
ncbi:MAG: M23 family metallopeptidase [Myxococcota bacterium]